MMKFLTLIMAFIFITIKGLMADEDISSRKQKMLDHHDMRIKRLQDSRNCISSAQTKEELKKCRKSMKESRQAMKEKFQEGKAQRKAAREKKRQED